MCGIKLHHIATTLYCEDHFTLVFFLLLRGFQHRLSRAHIEAKPILFIARLVRDINTLVAWSLVGLELTKRYTPSQHYTNCSLGVEMNIVYS